MGSKSVIRIEQDPPIEIVVHCEKNDSHYTSQHAAKMAERTIAALRGEGGEDA